MKAVLKIDNPDEVQATVTLTMRLKEWKELSAQLDSSYPSWKLSEIINGLVSKAERYYAPEEKE